MGNQGSREDDHVRDIPEGAGCAEIWEKLSEYWNQEEAE